MESIETLENGKFIAEIFYDNDPESPRDWDNLGTFIVKSNRYFSGDKNNIINFDDYNSYDEVKKELEKQNYIVVPVFAYVHSGVTVNTTGFSCPWDSSQCGFIVVSKEKIKKEYSWKKLSSKRIEEIKEYLIGEIETFDQYLQGDVYGYKIYENGEEIDSCWGFYGREYVTEEIQSIFSSLSGKVA